MTRLYEAKCRASASSETAAGPSMANSASVPAGVRPALMDEMQSKNIAHRCRSVCWSGDARPCIASGANVDDDPSRCDRGESKRIPVSKVNAALRFGATNLRGLRSSVYAVVGLGQSHPDHSDGVVGAWCDIGLHIVCLGAMNERRIVR